MILLYIHCLTISKEASSQGISVFSGKTSILVDSFALKFSARIPLSNSILLSRIFLLCYKFTSNFTSFSSQFLIYIIYPFSFSTLLTTIYCWLSTISLTDSLSNAFLFILSIKSFSTLQFIYRNQLAGCEHTHHTKQYFQCWSVPRKTNLPKSLNNKGQAISLLNRRMIYLC